MIKFRFAALAATIAVFSIFAAGCGSTDKTSATTASSGASTATSDAAMKEQEKMKADEKMKKEESAMMMAAESLKTGKTAYGTILQDAKGHSIYLFTKDGKQSDCYGACAKAWPPVIVSKTPTGRSGVKSGLLGTVKRSNGKLQATYNGQPLYYFVKETKANQVLCQGVAEFGGTWYVINPDGSANKTS